MPTFMGKVHAGGIYQRLLTLLDFVTVSLYWHKINMCHSIVSAIKVATHFYLIKKTYNNGQHCHIVNPYTNHLLLLQFLV